MKHFAVGAFLLLAACAKPEPLPADTRLKLDPIAFFTGYFKGQAELSKAFSQRVPVRVDSHGTTDKEGHLLLRQIIQEGQKEPRYREWTMRRVSPGRFTGSLTDAAGPVTVRTSGPKAFIDYRMKNGVDVHQELALQPGGKIILNRLTVSKFGIQLARLEETIRKLD